ncbi:membrane protein of unknown function (plasmid) [Caballeronia sp. S22]
MNMSQTVNGAQTSPMIETKPVQSISSEEYAASERTLAKVFRRILPFIFACYVISYLDRTNVGFAALTMNKDLGLTAEQFGFGAGMFFIGYFLFEIPSNLIMQKVGARIWIARIMISWGILSMATAFVVGPKSFAAARFLLGLAEAGFTPGIYLYFTHWFPGKWRAKVTAAFLVGIPVANIIGSPISGALLQLGGMHGLRREGRACPEVVGGATRHWCQARQQAARRDDQLARVRACVHQLLRHRRVDRRRPVDAADHQAAGRRAFGRRLADRDSLRRRRRGHAAVGKNRCPSGEPNSLRCRRAGGCSSGPLPEHLR